MPPTWCCWAAAATTRWRQEAAGCQRRWRPCGNSTIGRSPPSRHAGVFRPWRLALGGEVVTDLSRAELGTETLFLTDAGSKILCSVPCPGNSSPTWDTRILSIVCRPTAQLLASSQRVRNQAFRIPDKPLYCTQFHPELTRDTFLERVRAYPEYVERIAGVPYEEFAARCTEAFAAGSLIRRCVRAVLWESRGRRADAGAESSQSLL